MTDSPGSVDNRIHSLTPSFSQDSVESGQQDEVESPPFIGKHMKDSSPEILDHLARLAQTQGRILIENAGGQIDQKSQAAHFLFLFLDESLVLLIRMHFFFHSVYFTRF